MVCRASFSPMRPPKFSQLAFTRSLLDGRNYSNHKDSLSRAGQEGIGPKEQCRTINDRPLQPFFAILNR
jgi:hypothetical protein